MINALIFEDRRVIYLNLFLRTSNPLICFYLLLKKIETVSNMSFITIFVRRLFYIIIDLFNKLIGKFS